MIMRMYLFDALIAEEIDAGATSSSTFRTAAQRGRLPSDLQAFADYPEPPEPWKLPLPWSATIRLTRE